VMAEAVKKIKSPKNRLMEILAEKQKGKQSSGGLKQGAQKKEHKGEVVREHKTAGDKLLDIIEARKQERQKKKQAQKAEEEAASKKKNETEERKRQELENRKKQENRKKKQAQDASKAAEMKKKSEKNAARASATTSSVRAGPKTPSATLEMLDDKYGRKSVIEKFSPKANKRPEPTFKTALKLRDAKKIIDAGGRTIKIESDIGKYFYDKQEGVIVAHYWPGQPKRYFKKNSKGVWATLKDRELIRELNLAYHYLS